ncbi:MAG: prepilin-type N-terminal cleavage/methylation domain-containing protein [Gammaproteobacteria bacterium]|nr:prepilin-type N-terminal cleavage/methylation domain-containing protein [Gammaproteobacteria bacterium]
MTKKQAGFTLIELVVVLVLLGIIGAVATARFQDLSGDARLAALQGIAAEIQSGSAINYAEGVLDATYTQVVTNATACSAIAAGLLTSGVPSGWTVAGNPAACGTAGNVDNACTLTNDADAAVTTTFTVICTG